MTSNTNQGPQAPSQEEIFLLEFEACPSCRVGLCRQHAEKAPMTDKDTEKFRAHDEKTRQVLRRMSLLPLELQDEVVSHLEFETLLSITHLLIERSHKLKSDPEAAGYADVPALFSRDFKASPEETEELCVHVLLRAMKTRFSGELAYLFPLGFADDHFRSEPVTQAQHYTLVEFIGKSTDVVTAHLTEELTLPATFAEEVRWTVIRLWRVFGTTAERETARHGGPGLDRYRPYMRTIDGYNENSLDTIKTEALDYYSQLPIRDQIRIMSCLRELGVQYEKVHPVPLDRYEQDQKREAFREFKKSGQFIFVLQHYIMEYVRVGMTEVFAQVSRGQRIDAKAAFGRQGLAPWTRPNSRPASIPTDVEDYFTFDAWTYSAGITEEATQLYLPDHHTRDMFATLMSHTLNLRSCILEEGQGIDGPLAAEWEADRFPLWDPAVDLEASGVRFEDWRWIRPQPDNPYADDMYAYSDYGDDGNLDDYEEEDLKAAIEIAQKADGGLVGGKYPFNMRVNWKQAEHGLLENQ